HSTVHVSDDKVSNPLRDPFDLAVILRHFGQRAGFWEELLARAELHGLRRPLYHLLRHVQRVLETPIPSKIEEAARAGAPGPLTGFVMDWLFRHRLATRRTHNCGAEGRVA